MVLEENFKSIIRIYEVMLIVYFRRKEEVEYLEYWNIWNCSINYSRKPALTNS